MNLPTLLAAWFGLSVPAAVIVGAVLHGGSGVHRARPVPAVVPLRQRLRPAPSA